MWDVVVLVAGVGLAAVGGELFVRGAVGLALWARVPAAVIGSTVAAFATSSPEFAVAVTSATEGRPELALGDAAGSNVVNIGLVLGLAVLLAGLRADRSELGRDLGVALGAPVLTLVLAVDGSIGRLDAVVLLAVFAGWLAATARHARRVRNGQGDPAHADLLTGGRGPSLGASLGFGAAGLGVLALSGLAIVGAAKGIGSALGLDPFIVGATLVAFGTSAPELATTLIARWRGHDEVGLGTVLGSNIFNNLWIVGVAALISPITVSGAAVPVALLIGAVLVVLAIPGASGRLARPRGAVLVVGYVVNVVVMVALGVEAAT